MIRNRNELIKSLRGRRTSGDETYAKPFFKWAGGKSQLLYEFDPRFPKGLFTGEVRRYIEPFVGGGAVFFYIAQLCPIKEWVIGDTNPELILTWHVVKQDADSLIARLQAMQDAYDAAGTEEERLALFYQVRDALNQERSSFDYATYGDHTITRAAQLLFLNKTCFNGLFRLNSKGEFNVPFGKYKTASIVIAKNLLMVSKLLANTTIICGDFTTCMEYVDPTSFVYLDPPYRPLNKTSSFTGYSQEGFFEQDQIRLCEFFKAVDAAGALVMLSNSDPRNEDPEDHFFDDLYKDYVIERVPAKRFINSVGEKRGDINELIIRNYEE